MTAVRWSHIFALGALGLAPFSPTRAAAQGCSFHTCTAVEHVTVTVPARLALSARTAQPAVRANTAWRLAVDVERIGSGSASGAPAASGDRSRVTEIRDRPAAGAVAVRYTLVGT